MILSFEHTAGGNRNITGEKRKTISELVQPNLHLSDDSKHSVMQVGITDKR